MLIAPKCYETFDPQATTWGTSSFELVVWQLKPGSSSWHQPGNDVAEVHRYRLSLVVFARLWFSTNAWRHGTCGGSCLQAVSDLWPRTKCLSIRQRRQELCIDGHWWWVDLRGDRYPHFLVLLHRANCDIPVESRRICKKLGHSLLYRL